MMQVHEIQRSEYLRLLKSLDWMPTNTECSLYEQSIDHEYVVVNMPVSFGKVYKFGSVFVGFDSLSDANERVQFGEELESRKLKKAGCKPVVTYEYEIWHVVEPKKLEPSEPFRVWMLSNGEYAAGGWYARSGQSCKNLGLYIAKQMKHPHYVYEGLWPDYEGHVCAWCLNGYTGCLEKCKVVKCNRTLKMVTTYGEDVAVLVRHVDADELMALSQLRAAAVM